MAQAPMSMPDPDAGTDTGADDTDTGADSDADMGDQSPTVLVTIAQGPDGGYIVYAGDEPDEPDADDTGAAGAMAGAAGAGAAAGAAGGTAGGGGGAVAPEGQQVDSIGAALKAAMDILQESENSAGDTGSSQDQFDAGYNENQSPTPAAGKAGRLKYPPNPTA